MDLLIVPKDVGTGTDSSIKIKDPALISPTTLATIEESPIFSIPKSEVVRRPREREEPIRLFGETNEEVYLRLR